MEHQKIIFSNEISALLDALLAEIQYTKLIILTDVNTHQFVLPLLSENAHVANATQIVIKSGDLNKNLESLTAVWKQLDDCGATRKALLINLGGGVVTDLGGFAASTFKRGIRFINIPTTLLCAVDAAIGGKTGINFNGLKNEIGAFNEASAVIISTLFFKTLHIEELKSGYAEMLKHGLISNAKSYEKLLDYDFEHACAEHLLSLLEESVEVKKRVVEEDPFEKGIRRALNLGHTVGHAFESFAMSNHEPIPHGYAVAWGLVVELIISHIELGFDSQQLQRFATFVYENYGAFHVTCDDYPALLNYMSHDKKSNNGEMNFTLLKEIGDIKIDCIVDAENVKSALDIYRDLMHI
ncbi:MAG: 3-dehydroquinate synthase [Muribaculaceae bacterium]